MMNPVTRTAQFIAKNGMNSIVKQLNDAVYEASRLREENARLKRERDKVIMG
jgi:hypothetical protein